MDYSIAENSFTNNFNQKFTKFQRISDFCAEISPKKAERLSRKKFFKMKISKKN